MRTFTKCAPVIAALMLLSGCSGGHAIFSNYREISQLQIIQTLGVDTSEKGTRVTVSSSRGPEGEPPTLISREGVSISKAIENIQDYTSKEYIFYSHTKNIMVGHDKAVEGIGGLLDYVERSPFMRLGINLYIVKDSPASEIITASESDDYDISEVLAAIERDVQFFSEGQIYNCAQVSRQLAESGAAIVCAVEAAPAEDAIFSEHPEFTTRPVGCAVLGDGKLIGYITGEDAKAVSLIQDKLYGSSVQIKDPDSVTVTLEYTSSESNMKPVWNPDGSLKSLNFSYKVHTGLANISGEADLSDREFLARFEEALSRDIKRRVEGVLDFSIESGADFLQLGKMVERADPVGFSKLPGDWQDALGSLDYNVEVKTEINSSYDTQNPINRTGGVPDNAPGK